MKVKNQLRILQKAITDNITFHAEKTEKILGAIENLEKTIAALNVSLSAILGLRVKAAAVAAKAPKAKIAKAAKVKPVMKPNAAMSLKERVRDFLAKAGKPMKIAEIVMSMQKAGHVFESKKPIKVMTKLMYNNAKVFKRVKPGTFKAV